MKKRQIALLCVLLCILLTAGIFLFTGTGGFQFPSAEEPVLPVSSTNSVAAQQGDVPQGRYQEEESLESVWYSEMLTRQNGEILWGEWREQEGRLALVDTAGDTRQLAPEGVTEYGGLPDGSFWGSVWDEETQTLLVSHYSEQGELLASAPLSGFPHCEPPETVLQFRKIAADTERVYVLSYFSEDSYPCLRVYRWSGELLLEKAGVQDMAIDGEGTLMAIAEDSRNMQTSFALVRHSFATGEEIVETPLWDEPYQVEYSPADGEWYLVTAQGVALFRPGVRGPYEYSNESNLAYLLRVGEDTSFFRESLASLQDFTMGADRSLAFLFGEGREEDGQWTWVKVVTPFRFVAGAQAEEQEATLTITVPYADAFLREAVVRYEAACPDTKIQIDAAYPSQSGYEAEADLYRDQITARLLAGDVGDVVSLSVEGIPVQSFLSSEELLDLSTYLDGLGEMLNPTLLKAVEWKGAVRGLPVSLSVPCLAMDGTFADQLGVDPASLTSWTEIFSLLPAVEEQGEDASLFNGGKTELYTTVLETCLPLLVNEEERSVSLDEPWFRETLEALRVADASPQLAVSQEFSLYDHLNGSLFALVDLGGDAHLFDEWKRSLEVPSQRYLPLPGARIASCDVLYGISASSQNQQEAWNFLAFLYEDRAKETYTIPFDGIPAAQIGWEQNFESRLEPLTETGARLEQEFLSLAQGAEVLAPQESVTQIAAAHLQLYLNGEETLEDMLRAAEEEIWIFLNE